ncbi:MAG: virulence factor BrkB family protein [Pseudomonadota bacterium]
MNESETQQKQDPDSTGSASISRAIEPLTPLTALTDLTWLRAFSSHLWQQFRFDRSFESAGALSFTSLLALVPLMAVMFGVISAFPVFDQWATDIESYIFQNFVPAAGDQVQRYLQEFVGRTTGLTRAGTIFLILTAILLMATIEKSFNRIWRVTTSRNLISRLVTYWAALTLGPMLMGASLALTSYLAALPLLAPEAVRGAVQAFILNTTPFFVTLVGFTLVFLVVPNRRVRLRHALAGALVSAILFEAAKRGFVLYVTQFPTYERLYGALATVPIFLVWIYVSWVVVLLGASLAAALTTFNYQHVDRHFEPRHELLLALRLLGHFWQAQRRGDALSTKRLGYREPSASEAQIERLLDVLHVARVIHPDDDGDWMLTADLDELTLDELYRAGPFILPVGELDELPVDSHWDRALIERLKPLDHEAHGMMRRSVKSLLRFQMEND